MATETDRLEARAIFDRLVEDAETPDQRATRELLREYFLNPDFRQAMTEMVRLQIEGA